MVLRGARRSLRVGRHRGEMPLDWCAKFQYINVGNSWVSSKEGLRIMLVQGRPRRAVIDPLNRILDASQRDETPWSGLNVVIQLGWRCPADCQGNYKDAK